MMHIKTAIQDLRQRLCIINTNGKSQMVHFKPSILSQVRHQTKQQPLTNIWNMTIKTIRSRSGFTDPEALVYNTSWTNADLQNIIRRERRSELALEGLRIFDIRRWKTAETLLNVNPHGAKYGDAGTDNGYIRLDKRSFNKTRD